MSGRRAEVDIEHDDRDGERERDHDDGEEQVLADERRDERRGRNELVEQQDEHSEREQNANRQANLLAALARQVEGEYGEKRDAYARYDL